MEFFQFHSPRAGRTRVRSREAPANPQLSYPPASRGREWNFPIPHSPRAGRTRVQSREKPANHLLAYRSGGVGGGGVDKSPQHRPVFAIVGYGPDASRGLDKRLVAIVVELRREIVDGSVLIERIGCIDGIRATLGQRLAVADVVVMLGVGNRVVLRDDVGRRCVADLKQLAVGIVLPRRGKAVGVGERGLEVRTRQIRPRECAFILNGRAACSSS